MNDIIEVNFESLAIGVVCLVGGTFYKKVAPAMAVSLDDGHLLLDGTLVKQNGLPQYVDKLTCLVNRGSLRGRWAEGF